jgi:hypothetical protein
MVILKPEACAFRFNRDSLTLYILIGKKCQLCLLYHARIYLLSVIQRLGERRPIPHSRN